MCTHTHTVTHMNMVCKDTDNIATTTTVTGFLKEGYLNTWKTRRADYGTPDGTKHGQLNYPHRR